MQQKALKTHFYRAYNFSWKFYQVFVNYYQQFLTNSGLLIQQLSSVMLWEPAADPWLFIADIQTPALVHESLRAEVDHQDPLHRSDLWATLLGQSAVLHPWKLPRVHLCCSRLLWGWVLYFIAFSYSIYQRPGIETIYLLLVKLFFKLTHNIYLGSLQVFLSACAKVECFIYQGKQNCILIVVDHHSVA